MPPDDLPSFALLELFTSEGCSSCPPADQSLEAITAQAERTGRRVFTLSFHVDYWNDLGWTDPFSDARSTAHQQEYLLHFKQRGAYTPELVVNGVEEFVGSDATRTRDATMRMLARPAKTDVGAAVTHVHDGLLVHYAVRGGPERALVQVALVQRRAKSTVTRGENSGRELVHSNVVRDFRVMAVALPARGEVPLALPAGLDVAAASVLVFVSNPDSREVLGVATAAPLG